MQFIILAAANIAILALVFYGQLEASYSIFIIGVINFFTVFQILNKKRSTQPDSPYYSLNQDMLNELITQARSDNTLLPNDLLSRMNYPINESGGFLDNGQFRRSITITLILVYISLLAFQTSNRLKPLDNEEMKSLTQLITFVILFYFGSRAIQDYKSLSGS